MWIPYIGENDLHNKIQSHPFVSTIQKHEKTIMEKRNERMRLTLENSIQEKKCRNKVQPFFPHFVIEMLSDIVLL